MYDGTGVVLALHEQHVRLYCCVFFFKQKTAYEIASCLVGSEMCIRDSAWREGFAYGPDRVRHGLRGRLALD